MPSCRFSHLHDLAQYGTCANGFRSGKTRGGSLPGESGPHRVRHRSVSREAVMSQSEPLSAGSGTGFILHAEAAHSTASEAAAAQLDGADAPSRPWHRLSTRIIASSLVALVVVLGMIGTTLWLSWRLEGAGAAINDTGSLRMRAHRIAVELMAPRINREARVLEQLRVVDATLALLAKGNAQRPLLLPDNRYIRAQLSDVTQYW